MRARGASALGFAGFEFRGTLTRLSPQKAGAFTASDTARNVGGAVPRRFALTLDYVVRLRDLV